MNRPIAGQKALIVLAALVAMASNARAQNSNPWGDVASWQATYSLTGTGEGTTTDGLFVYTWTVNRQFTASGVLTSGMGSSAVPGLLYWLGPASTASGSGSSNGQAPPPPNCGPYAISWSGSAASPGAFFDGSSPLLELNIDLSKQTYSVLDSAVVPGTYTRTDCGVQKSGSLGLILGPLLAYYTADNKIVNVSPKSFGLPQTFGVLQQTASFMAPAETYLLDSNAIPAATWNLSFKLIPSRPWVKVWMSGAGQATTSRETKRMRGK
jgi:hypothetical protein